MIAPRESLTYHVGYHGSWGSASQEEQGRNFNLETFDEKLQERIRQFRLGVHPDAQPSPSASQVDAGP